MQYNIKGTTGDEDIVKTAVWSHNQRLHPYLSGPTEALRVGGIRGLRLGSQPHGTVPAGAELVAAVSQRGRSPPDGHGVGVGVGVRLGHPILGSSREVNRRRGGGGG